MSGREVADSQAKACYTRALASLDVVRSAGPDVRLTGLADAVVQLARRPGLAREVGPCVRRALLYAATSFEGGLVSGSHPHAAAGDLVLELDAAVRCLGDVSDLPDDDRYDHDPVIVPVDPSVTPTAASAHVFLCDIVDMVRVHATSAGPSMLVRELPTLLVLSGVLRASGGSRMPEGTVDTLVDRANDALGRIRATCAAMTGAGQDGTLARISDAAGFVSEIVEDVRCAPCVSPVP